MAKIDEIIHQSVRLQIMAALVSIEDKTKVDFSLMRKKLNVTDGNLSAHLKKLEEAGYIQVEKTFVNRKPRTYLNVTGSGKDAFKEHLAALKEILGDS